jgi:hypothetical protein
VVKAPVFPRQLRCNKSFPKKNVAIPIALHPLPPPKFPPFSLFLAPATTNTFLVQRSEPISISPFLCLARLQLIVFVCSTASRIESTALISHIVPRSAFFLNLTATVPGGCSVLRVEGIQKDPPPLFASRPPSHRSSWRSDDFRLISQPRHPARNSSKPIIGPHPPISWKLFTGTDLHLQATSPLVGFVLFKEHSRAESLNSFRHGREWRTRHQHAAL